MMLLDWESSWQGSAGLLCPRRTVPIRQLQQDKENCKSEGNKMGFLLERKSVLGLPPTPFKWQ